MGLLRLSWYPNKDILDKDFQTIPLAFSQVEITDELLANAATEFDVFKDSGQVLGQRMGKTLYPEGR